MTAARYVVVIDDEVDAMSATPVQAAALMWVTSVFSNGGLASVVSNAVSRLTSQGTVNRVLNIRAWRLTEPDIIAQRIAVERLVLDYHHGAEFVGVVDAIIELLT